MHPLFGFFIPFIIIIFVYVIIKFTRNYILKHKHNYCIPIVSKYVSFNTRDIVYECKCGKRIIKREYYTFNEEFPINTTPHITDKELQKIANNTL